MLSIEGVRKLEIRRQFLEDCLLGELLVRMRQEGWQWRPRPRSKAEQLLRYSIGDPRVWHCSSVNVPRSYLHCLLDVENLNRNYGITWAPHCAHLAVHDKILQGVAPQDAMSAAIEDATHRKKRKAASQLMIESEDPGQCIPPPQKQACPVLDGDICAGGTQTLNLICLSR